MSCELVLKWPFSFFNDVTIVSQVKLGNCTERVHDNCCEFTWSEDQRREQVPNRKNLQEARGKWVLYRR